MARHGARLHWAVWSASGVLIAGLGAFFVKVGLDEADKYASVAGAFGTLAGLGLALVSLIGRQAPGEPPLRESEPTAGQRMRGSSISGDAIQVRGVGGDVRIGSAPPAPLGGGPRRPPRETSTTRPASADIQSVDDVRIGGSGIQVDQVTGDVDVERGA